MNLFLKIVITLAAVVCVNISQAFPPPYTVLVVKPTNDSEHLQYEVLPEGPFKGLAVKRRWLEHILEYNFQRLSRVYDLTFSSELYLDDFNVLKALGQIGFRERALNAFTTSFSVKTVEGVSHHDIQCKTKTYLYLGVEPKLLLENCRNEQVEFFDDSIQIDLNRKLFQIWDEDTPLY